MGRLIKKIAYEDLTDAEEKELANKYNVSEQEAKAIADKYFEKVLNENKKKIEDIFEDAINKAQDVICDECDKYGVDELLYDKAKELGVDRDNLYYAVAEYKPEIAAVFKAIEKPYDDEVYSEKMNEACKKAFEFVIA